MQPRFIVVDKIIIAIITVTASNTAWVWKNLAMNHAELYGKRSNFQ